MVKVDEEVLPGAILFRAATYRQLKAPPRHLLLPVLIAYRLAPVLVLHLSPSHLLQSRKLNPSIHPRAQPRKVIGPA